MRPLGHIVHVEKFVVGGVGGGSEQHVLTVILVLSLRPKLNNIVVVEGFSVHLTDLYRWSNNNKCGSTC